MILDVKELPPKTVCSQQIAFICKCRLLYVMRKCLSATAFLFSIGLIAIAGETDITC